MLCKFSTNAQFYKSIVYAQRIYHLGPHLQRFPHLPGVSVNGEMYHLRNMDWEMPVLKKVTILTQFFKSGRMVHQGITWVGFVGTYTQLSNKGYSISLNCELAVGIVTD